MADGTCTLCSVSFAPDNVVPVNGTDEQIAAQRERLDDLRRKGRHAKGKKRKLAEESAEPNASNVQAESTLENSQTAADAKEAKRRSVALQADAAAAPDSRRACAAGLSQTSGHQRT
jgi:hypothetical protein